MRAALRVFSRPGCHLCEQLVEQLLPLVRDRLAVEVVDVESRPDWEEEYGLRIPVVEFDGRFVCQYELDTGAIRHILENLPASRAD
jgi:hypothetical protein